MDVYGWFVMLVNVVVVGGIDAVGWNVGVWVPWDEYFGRRAEDEEDGC